MWVGTDADALVSVWAEELAAYELVDMKHALDALRYSNPEWPPTAFEFANLCKEAMRGRVQSMPQITSVRYGGPSPEVLAAIHELTRDPLKRQRDPKDWARRILQRETAGERQPIYAVTSAREALGL
ncbi:MAG: hypothetical protein KGI71_05840 [Patescibacteria group bacterium]|nr:hypothetical protein [Patescibacteria group bacterium]